MTSASSFITKQSVQLHKELKQLTKELNLADPTTICVASKYATAGQIQQLYDEGFRVFGENKIQDGIQKIQQLEALDIEWHFIGHLQKNKVNKAVQYFDVIQSVDSFGLLEKINQSAQNYNKQITCFIQLNTGYDPKKFGLLPEDFLKEKEKFFSLSNVVIKGIMVIAPYLEDNEKLSEIFNYSFNIFKLTFENSKRNHLSMGMSQDYKLAIKAGSTMVRIGRMLFKQT